MEYIPNSKPLHDIVHSEGPEDFKQIALITAGAQVLRLFLDYNIIHTDLHGGNIIVDESGMSYIIDFGMVFDLSATDGRLSAVKESRERYKRDLSRRPNRLSTVRDSMEVGNTCLQIFEELKLVEQTINGRFQMETLFSELRTRNLYYPVIIKYIELSRSSSGNLPRKTIIKQIEEGDIELINDDGLNALVEQMVSDPIHNSEKTFTTSGDTSASATVLMGLGITRRKKRRTKLKRKKSKKPHI
jgi:hypothetical protein